MFSVLIATSALREFHTLPENMQKRLTEVFQTLRAYPSTHHLRIAKLESPSSPTYRIRIGDYRILFEIDGVKREIFITKIEGKIEREFSKTTGLNSLKI